MAAAQFGHYDIVLYLARRGADLTRRVQGRTALDIAREYCRADVAGLLEDVALAGGWGRYVAELRYPHCVLRHRVGATYATLPVDDEERELYHLVYGRSRNDVKLPPAAAAPAAFGASSPMAELPDDVFPLVLKYLVGCVRGGRAAVL